MYPNSEHESLSLLAAVQQLSNSVSIDLLVDITLASERSFKSSFIAWLDQESFSRALGR